mgnify:FL=1
MIYAQKKEKPSSSSSCEIAEDIAGKDTFSASDARAMLPVSPIKIEYSDCRKVKWDKSRSMIDVRANG